MKNIRVLIADDEPLARQLLASYLQQLPGFQLVASCANALEAFAVFNRETVDLLLLDINMPEISGLDFVKSLKHPPKIIFTTAHAEHAVESYELHAVDYLLKPVTFGRFMQAMYKLEMQMAPTPASGATVDNILFVKSEGKMVRINPEGIWLIEGYGNYVRLWSASGKLILHSTMKSVEESFERYPLFTRISKSYIVNLAFIDEMTGNYVRIGNETIPIGTIYREGLKKLFEQRQLL